MKQEQIYEKYEMKFKTQSPHASAIVIDIILKENISALEGYRFMISVAKKLEKILNYPLYNIEMHDFLFGGIQNNHHKISMVVPTVASKSIIEETVFHDLYIWFENPGKRNN